MFTWGAVGPRCTGNVRHTVDLGARSHVRDHMLRGALLASMVVACRPVEPTVAPPRGATAVVVPVIDGRLQIAERRDGVVRATLGSIRAEVSGGAVALAGDRFAFPIIGAVPSATGWLFAAADGAVARADRFLGPLHSLGAVPRDRWLPRDRDSPHDAGGAGAPDELRAARGSRARPRRGPVDHRRQRAAGARSRLAARPGDQRGVRRRGPRNASAGVTSTTCSCSPVAASRCSGGSRR
jgi:hypothetical protein